MKVCLINLLIPSTLYRSKTKREFILSKKPARVRAKHSVPVERVVAIKVPYDVSIKVGPSWTPAVVDFYKEMFPDIIETGFGFDQSEVIIEIEEF
ncbi:MAG: hypothetical protein ACOX0W_07595 [Sphaerochaetaceae bacterium]|jgi:hypothetical protein